MILAVGNLAGGHRQSVGEVVHRGDLRAVPHLLQAQPEFQEAVDVGPGRLVRSTRDFLGVVADRFAAFIEPGTSPVEGDAVRQHGIAERFAQRLTVRDEAVKASVRHRHDDSDHLSISRRQVLRRNMQLLEMAEPGSKMFDPVGVRLEHVGYESDDCFGFGEEPHNVVGQFIPIRDGVPGDLGISAHEGHGIGSSDLGFSVRFAKRDALGEDCRHDQTR